jgi:nucleoid-associated protein YgaU
MTMTTALAGSALVGPGLVSGGRYEFRMTTTRPLAKTRITRRGRLLLLGLLVALTFAAFSLGRVSGNADTGGASTSSSYVKVVVQPGDTLWSIARAAHPGKDPRGYVQRIVDLNSLPSSDVRVGQVLSLPR